ncbi:MAG: winged helix-turn-helix domain-containing protein [Xanthomonadales bacterium]|nr:winged helix-turn-helix domain-containing protein [Xanthomonadales bacterium]MCB1633248.1 winged helix-turn-helix domain-containing protein [Xanthomonadales bacterium]
MNAAAPTMRWHIGAALQLDGPERSLRRGHEAITLPPRAFDLLVRLAQAEGRLLGKSQLLEEVWDDRLVEDGTLSRHIWLLRKALGADAALLETVPKVGYRLLGVSPLSDPSVVAPVNSAASGPGSANSTPADSSWRGWRGLLGGVVAIVLMSMSIWGVWRTQSGERSSGTVQQEQAQLLAVRAQALMARRSEADLLEAIQLYRQALALAPEQAQHHAGLAMALALVSDVALPAETNDSARQSAQQALALQPDNANALAVLGLVAMNRDRDWLEAEARFRQALAIDPTHLRSRHWLGELLVLLGERQTDGLAELEQAHALAPMDVAIASDLAKAAYFSRRYDQAVDSATRAMALDPAFAHSYRWRALAGVEVGQCVQAMADARAAVRLDPAPVVRAEHIYVLGRCEHHQDASDLAAQLRSESQAGYITPIALLLVALALDERSAALDALEAAVRNGNMILGLATAPALDAIRSEPRFLALLAQLNAESRAVSSR